MSSEKYICIGKIHSAQGLKGDLFVMLFSGEAAWEKKWRFLEIGDREGQTPNRQFQILSKRSHRKQSRVGFAVRVEGVADRNKAEELVGSRVFIPKDFLTSQKGEKIYLREILEFEILDESRGSVGSVVGFSDNGAQDLISISNSMGETYEVPLVEPILIRIDFEERKIFMDIPEGLLPGEGE